MMTFEIIQRKTPTQNCPPKTSRHYNDEVAQVMWGEHKAPKLLEICQDQEICPASDDLYAGPQDKMKHEISNAVFMFP